MRRREKKSKILETKKKIARLLKKNKKSFDVQPTKRQEFSTSNYWWDVTFAIHDKRYRLFLQRYIRRYGINYIDIRSMDYKALTVKEIKSLHNNMIKEIEA